MRPIFYFWKTLSARFFKPLKIKQKGIVLSYLENQEPQTLCFESARETDKEMILVPRIQPGKFLENTLIVLYIKDKKEINRYGLWFYGQPNNQIRLDIHLFKAPEMVFASLYVSNHACIAENKILEKETSFFLIPAYHHFILKIQEENRKIVEIPVWFEKMI